MSETENKEVISEKPEPMETDSKPVEKAAEPEASSVGGGDAPDQQPSPETNGQEEEEPEEDSKEEPAKEEPDEEKKEEEAEEAASEENGEEEGSDDDDEEEADSSEELKPGLLEQPLVQSGKRAKKKVERLSMTSSAEPKKKVEIKEGTGTKLGDIPRVEQAIGKNLAENLKIIHRICYSRVGTAHAVKKNIKQFSGFPFTKGSAEYDRKLASLKKLTLSQLKNVCSILDVERKGTRDDIVERLMAFLMKPESSGKSLPAPKTKRKRSSTGGKKASSTPGKRGRKPGSKNKTPTKKKKKEEKTEETVEDSDDESEEEEEEDESEQEKEEQENSKSDADEEEEESEEEEEVKEPPKKKTKKEETPKKAKKEESPKKQKKTPVKEVKKEKEKKKKSSDDQGDSKKKAKKANKPPSDDELKDVIKKILDGANLEEVTMKTLCKQVYAKYPNFDLTERKDFIKATVKQIIR